ncbi:hypothetical protein QQF64_017009 [Cirrhinus molitorella]|uniref:Secreted protein n=1 Tax=Cirrhinus molitorella TaxID=172907 RepID=A0ABR3LPE8_9TELE
MLYLSTYLWLHSSAACPSGVCFVGSTALHCFIWSWQDQSPPLSQIQGLISLEDRAKDRNMGRFSSDDHCH